MRSKIIKGIVLLGISFSYSVFADEKGGHFFIEPDVGYGLSGSLKSAGTSVSSFSGLSVGGRAGIKIAKVIMIGPSIKYLPSLSYKAEGSTTNASPNPTLMTIGGFIGIAPKSF